MSLQQQLGDRLTAMGELVKKGEQVLEQLQLDPTANFSETLREFALINRALHGGVAEYHVLAQGMSVAIVDGDRLFRGDHDVLLDIYFPPGSPKRREAETNGVHVAFLEPFTVEGERIVGVKLANQGGLEVQSLKDIARFRMLQTLTILMEELSDLGDLRGHPSLSRLCLLNNSRLSDLSPLTEMPALRQLQFFQSPIAGSLAPVIFSLDKLEELDLGPQSIRSLKGISGMKALRKLSVWHSPVEDISELKELPALQELKLDHTNIRDLTPLLDCSWLKAISINPDQFKSSSWARWRNGLPDNSAVLQTLRDRGIRFQV